MTIFSLVIIVNIIFKCARKPSQKLTELFVEITALAVALEVMMSVGYFIRIGHFELGYSEVLIIADTILSIILLLKGKLNKIQLFCGAMLIVTCCISLVLQIILPYSGIVVPSEAAWDFYYFLGQVPGTINIGTQQIKEIAHIICYVLVMWQMFLLCGKQRHDLIVKIYNYERPFIWFGIIEFVIIKILGMQSSWTALEIKIFGNSYIGDGAMLSIGVSNRLRGLKSEPSMYGFALFIFFVQAILLYKDERKKEYKIYAYIALVLMACSLSFTAIVCFAGLVLYWLILKYKNGNSLAKGVIVAISSIVMVVGIIAIKYMYSHEFSSYYLKRIHMALINMDDLSITGWHGDYATYDGSTKIRMISIIGEFQYFVKRPLFGLALGSTYAHSTMATVIASIGCVGILAWCRFTFFPGKIKGGKIYLLAILCWLLLLIVLGQGLFPFYGVENIVVLYCLERFKKGKERLFKDET